MNQESINPQHLSALRDINYDQYFFTLLTPKKYRQDVLTIALFDSELARARWLTKEPPLALIRLQWWQEVLTDIQNGVIREHEYARPLFHLLTDRSSAELFELCEALIHARVHEIEQPGFSDTAEIINHFQSLSSLYFMIIFKLLQRDNNNSDEINKNIHSLGLAWGIIGHLRALPHRLHAGLPHGLPHNLCEEHEITPQQIISKDPKYRDRQMNFRKGWVEIVTQIRHSNKDIIHSNSKQLKPFRAAEVMLDRYQRLLLSDLPLYDPRFSRPNPWVIMRFLLSF